MRLPYLALAVAAACSSSSGGGTGDQSDAGAPQGDGGVSGGDGTTTPPPDAGPGQDTGTIPQGTTLKPNPLISRGKPIDSPQDNAKAAFDGSYDPQDGSWISNTSAADGSIADSYVSVNVGAGPTSVLLVWHNADDPDYTVTPSINFGVPTEYKIEVSPDGKTWTKAVDV